METSKVAHWAFLLAHISPIARRELDPIEGLKQLMAGIRSSNYDFETPAEKFLGDAYGIEELLGLYWIYDDALGQPYEFVSCNEYAKFNFAKLTEEAVVASANWVRQHSSKSSMPPTP